MAECIDRQVAIEQIKAEWAKLPLSETTGFGILMRVLTSIPAADVVSRGTYDQTDWERCVALTQLKEIEKGLGERMDDVRPVVKGEWKPSYDSTEYDVDGSTPLLEPRIFQDGWQCSLCGQYMLSETNFCPNCGCAMEGTE